jgi:hypothetical protein
MNNPISAPLSKVRDQAEREEQAAKLSKVEEGVIVHSSRASAFRDAVRIVQPAVEELAATLERAEALLRRYVQLADVTHAYPIMGGHDSIGENFTCAGCALRDEIRTMLDEPKEPRS